MMALWSIRWVSVLRKDLEIIDPETKEPKKDDKGNIVISKLNEQELTGISDATNGIYIHLENLEDATITLITATG